MLIWTLLCVLCTAGVVLHLVLTKKDAIALAKKAEVAVATKVETAIVPPVAPEAPVVDTTKL